MNRHLLRSAKAVAGDDHLQSHVADIYMKSEVPERPIMIPTSRTATPSRAPPESPNRAAAPVRVELAECTLDIVVAIAMVVVAAAGVVATTVAAAVVEPTVDVDALAETTKTCHSHL